MSIPTDRLREIATKAWALNDQVDPPNWTECEPMATELLACREERDRLKAVLLSKHGGEPLALLSELDEARAERDAARAEAEKLRKALIACGREAGGGLADDVSTDFLMHLPEEVRMRLAAVKRQRDELRSVATEVVKERDYLKQTEMHDNYTDRSRSMNRERNAVDRLVLLALAAEQPKPQQPEEQP